jgi:glycosyltransferase involved in cell wall biosynthesis
VLRKSGATSKQQEAKMIDVIIPTYGKTSRLRETLRAIERSAHTGVVSKILVIENGEKYAAEHACSEITDLTINYIHTNIQGLVNARNAGIAASSAPNLIFLDDDIKVEENYFIEYATAISKHGDRCFYGGPLKADYERRPPEWLKKYLPWSAMDYHPTQYSEDGGSAIFLGGNMCIPRGALIEAGGYEGLGASGSNNGGVGEESRLQERLLSLGYKAVCVSSAVGHHWIPVDRCSQNFVVQRQKRHAYTEAFYDERIFPLILNCPRWVVGHLLRSFVGRLRASKNPETRLQANIALQRSIGLMQGYRDRARSARSS